MHSTYYIKLFLLVNCMFVSSILFAQKEWTDGSLDPIEIEIVTERDIKLPRANRNYERIPPTATQQAKAPVTYNFRSFSFQAPEIKPLIRPLKVKQEGTSDVYGGYVTLGYGNYASPYLEGFFNSRKNKNRLVGAHVMHQSSGKGPVDGKNSGSGTSSVSLFGETFGKDLTFKGNVDYENRFTHFYGYDTNETPDEKEIRQAFNTFSLSGSVSNTRNTDFEYALSGNFSYLADRYKAQETEAGFDFAAAYKMSDDQRITLKAGYSNLSRKDELVALKPRNLFTARGAYQFMPQTDLKLSVGLTAAFENDSISKDVHVYPDINASYTVSPSVDVVGRLSGDIEKVSLHSLSAENWWLAPNVDIFHTNKSMALLFGVNARLGKKVEAHTGVEFATLKNLYYFVNTTGDPSKFEVIYDMGATKRSNFYASLSYAQTEKAKFMLRGDYFAYTPKTVDEAWHRPVFKVTATSFLNVYDKILLHANLITQGGIKALDPVTGGTKKLDPAFDLNVRTEYLLSSSFSIFVQLNNITSSDYQVYLNYPVRRFQILGGLTWSF